MTDEPTTPCGNCGSGNLERALGSSKDRHQIRPNWTIDYKDVPGWHCNDCDTWSPDPKCVDERGNPTFRKTKGKSKSQRDSLYETYQKGDYNIKTMGGSCPTCKDLGVTKLDPVKICPNCEGLPNSLNSVGRFLVNILIKALQEQKGNSTTKVKYTYDPKAYYYGVLGLDQGATKNDIQKAYHKMSKAFHPDNEDTGDSDRFRLITEARRRLLGDE